MNAMHLKILLAHEVLLEARATKIVAEAENGSFGLRPLHIDFVTALTAGLLSFEDADREEEVLVAVDEGLLVKRGREVLVSTRQAVLGGSLGDLRETLEQEFHRRSEGERKARSAMARLESSLARRFLEVQKNA